MRDFILENKRKVIIIIIAILLTIVLSIINNVRNKSNLEGDTSKINPEDAIRELAGIYYENVAYPEIKKEYGSTANAVFENLYEHGLEVDLRTLVSSIENSHPEIFFREGNYCNFVNSYVTIYPDTSFAKDEYTISVSLDCVEEANSDKDVVEGGDFDE